MSEWEDEVHRVEELSHKLKSIPDIMEAQEVLHHMRHIQKHVDSQED